MLDAQVIEDPADDRIDKVFHCLRVRVERGHAGQNRRSRCGKPREVVKVNGRQGRLSRSQDQLPPLLQEDIGAAGEEIVGHPGGDPAEVPMLQGTMAIPS